MTNYATLEMKGRKYVLVPATEYSRLVADRREPKSVSRKAAGKQDARDVAVAKRRLAAGGFRPYSELRKELGL